MGLPRVYDLTQDPPRRSSRILQSKNAPTNQAMIPLSRPSFPTARPGSSSLREMSIPDIIDLTGDTSPPAKNKKRKERPVESTESPKKKKKGKGQNASHEDCEGAVQKTPEKRLRTFRPRETQEYLKIKDRALSQRMFLIDRVRHVTDEHPHEELLIAGTTGNIYTVTIDEMPTCDCPHALKGNQCKHIIFAMIRVLKAPQELQYQLALLKSELRLIFANAPPIISPEAVKSEAVAEHNDGKRKPIEGDCPICFTELDPVQDGSSVVYCKAACGNNFHRECFGTWTKTKQSSGDKVTCPLCRTEWETETSKDDVEFIKQQALSGSRNCEGYLNVAYELGLSGERDTSTYHQYGNWGPAYRRRWR